MVIALSLLIVASATLHLRAEYHRRAAQIYLFKPLTIVLVIALAGWTAATRAAPGASGGQSLYPILIIAGLGFSLLGDIILMLPSDRFVAGLICFLLAHMTYIAAFSLGTQISTAVWLFAPLALIVALMSRRLWPHLGAMKAPVLCYEIVIVAMAWRAAERWLQGYRPGSSLGLIGALLFVASDAALAIRRFVGPFRGDHIVIMGAYVAAQWAIALSML